MMRPPEWIAGTPLKSISVSRLGALSNIFVVLGVLSVVVAAGFAIQTLRIGGAMYGRIISSKNFVADVLPSPIPVVEAYHEVTRLADAPHESAQQIEKLKRLRQQYEARRGLSGGCALRVRTQAPISVGIGSRGAEILVRDRR